MYQAGSLNKTTVRLKKEQTYTGEISLKRDYQLTYDPGSATRRSQLINLVECAGDGTCITQEQFTWQNGPSEFTQAFYTDTFSPQGTGGWNMQVADINVDGKTDLIFKYPSINMLQTFLSNGDGTFMLAFYTDTISPQGTGGWSMQVADINGDGKTDLIFK